MIPSSSLQYIAHKKLNFYLIQIFSVFFILVLSGTVLAQSGEDQINIVMPTDAKVMRLDVKIGQWVYAGNILAVLKDSKGSKFKLRSGVSGRIESFKLQVHKQYAEGEIIGFLRTAPIIMEKVDSGTSVDTLPSFEQMFQNLFNSTGTSNLIHGHRLDWTAGLGRIIMIGVGFTLLYLGIRKSLNHFFWFQLVLEQYSQIFHWLVFLNPAGSCTTFMKSEYQPEYFRC